MSEQIDDEIDRLRKIIPKRLLNSPASAVIFAEELAERIKKFREKIRPEVKIPREIVETKTIDRKDIKIVGGYKLLDVNIPGILRELTIVSDDNNYRIRIEADDFVKIDRSFDELAEISPYSNMIDAMQNNNEYILHISDIKWKGKCRIMISALKQLTFKNILAVYDIKRIVKE